MTEIRDSSCEDTKCGFNRKGIRHSIQDHEKLEKENVVTLEKVFKPTINDHLHSSIKGGLAILPWAGGIIAEIFSTSVESPLYKRFTSYLKSIEERISELEKQGKLDSRSLSNDDEFIDILTQASQIAVRNSQKEKLETLKNCVINTAMKIDIERDHKMMYLNIINQITPTHLLILKTTDELEKTIMKLAENELQDEDEHSRVSVVRKLGELLRNKPELFEMIIKDLESWGILRNPKTVHTSVLDTPNIDMIIQDIEENIKSRLSVRGSEFIKFIQNYDAKYCIENDI